MGGAEEADFEVLEGQLCIMIDFMQGRITEQTVFFQFASNKGEG